MAQLKQRKNHKAELLFPLAANFQIVRLGNHEITSHAHEMVDLETLILDSETMYPDIGNWLKDKVIPGLKSGQRIAWVAYESGQAIASAVLKLGARSKFCHLKVREDFHDMDLGQMFFSQMALEARHDAKEIHFTLPESLWEQKRGFFQSFGFDLAATARRQYRRTEKELSCSASFETVWAATMKRLPSLARKFLVGGYSLNNRVLISIKPQHAGRILNRTKLVEIRKNFPQKLSGYGAVIYASTPQRALVGEATIKSVTAGTPAEIWERFGSECGCTEAEFFSYAGSHARVSAVELVDVLPYLEPIGLAQASYLVREDLVPPQSFRELSSADAESGWTKAVAVASMLHGRFGRRKNTGAS